jgi:hypothetical protein
LIIAEYPQTKRAGNKAYSLSQKQAGARPLEIMKQEFKMGEKLQNSIAMIKASARVLKSDKELFVFPVVSFTAVILVSVSFALPLFDAGVLEEGFSIYDPSVLPFAILYYFLTYFIVIFFNTALVGAAMIRLNGGNPTVSDGLKVASNRITSILGYTFISLGRHAAEMGSGKPGLFGKTIRLPVKPPLEYCYFFGNSCFGCRRNWTNRISKKKCSAPEENLG